MAADKCVVNNVSRYVVGLAHVGLADRAEVGGKNASIGELLKLEFRAPRGFAVTASAYQLFLEVNQLRERIAAILSELDTSRGDQLETASAKIRSAFEAGRFPPAVEEAIRGSYKTLAREVDDPEPSVAVRSSATSEDSAEASFAGQQDTYLHVRGEEQVLAFIKKCYGSVFTPRAIAYREERGFEHLAVQLSVGIMEMVNSKSSGVCFTLDPVSGKREVLVVEGSWGLGETVVQGKVMPDRFVLDKENLRMLERKISEKRLMMIRGKAEDADAHTIEIPVPDAMVHAPCVSEAQLHELAKVALRIEAHYGKPVDIEWAVDEDSNALYVVQARPETVWSLKKDASKRQTLIKGLGASPGKAHGAVHVIDDVRATEDFHEGEVLVTKMTTPDWVPAMRRAAAIVTDSGGMTAHAAIVSRELGLPCVVGTGKATEVLQNGQTVTVDGTLGVVLSGVHDDAKDGRGENGVRASGDVFIPTATRVYMNLGEPSVINEWRHLPFDGIGLMRVEFILASWVGQHPLDMLKRGQEDLFVEKLAEGIGMVAQSIYPRPVIVRFSDFKTNEYRALKGGEQYEPEESNPMLGWRGVSRYVSKEYEPAFRLECRALKLARDDMGLKNAWAMLPFARTTWEVRDTLQLMGQEGLQRSHDFKVFIMAEVPSVVLLADEFAKLCDGFSIGSNDLTQLLLGADRDSSTLASLGYFDERDPAVKKAMQTLIEEAHRAGITVGICGQAPSVYPELTEFLVRCGIDSVSVNPDAVVSVRRQVASFEQKMLLESVRHAVARLSG
ncbi:hypothetical protein CDCA_CDCA11G3257 [Cyanidium caldarium]|uniref:pyruvate, water dikinase n=1 Tax=Cyanidium caldarium TaxID=2771 RepID=A0AAV9IY76_CYACA|nr:hypothetical protein CDCA_CDCA11G3257 [Cyanidium caldarium]